MKTSYPERVREGRLRRMAKRQNLRLVKSGRRDPRAYDYTGWAITDAITGEVVAGDKPWMFSLTVDEVEAYLLGE